MGTAGLAWQEKTLAGMRHAEMTDEEENRMKSLQTIQKTFRIFQTLTKVMMVLSFVWAGLAALGLLCGVV